MEPEHIRGICIFKYILTQSQKIKAEMESPCLPPKLPSSGGGESKNVAVCKVSAPCFMSKGVFRQRLPRPLRIREVGPTTPSLCPRPLLPSCARTYGGPATDI